MPKQSKFENVDLFASLNAVMKQNTGFYQSDLEIDKEIIAKAAASPRKEDKTLLWFCRPSGTHCFRERDVFLKDTAPHNTWRFYMEQTPKLFYAYLKIQPHVGSLRFVGMNLGFLLGVNDHRFVINLSNFQFSHLLL